MKLFAILCIFLLVVVDLSMQIPQYVNCPEEFPRASMECACCKVTCSSDGDALRMDAVACGEFHCPEEKLLKYEGGDNTLLFHKFLPSRKTAEI
ncbi:hypothetical protein X777_07411 [Ooceraea biroi]|uniref:Pacifastin domain-containing protein n=1 Tax=Ooceraea biroi TaxID=2015173 RepID=A0A026WB99_OOCBI|nr:hypothetical protein X777_07411 [Ooceraea biroi]